MRKTAALLVLALSLLFSLPPAAARADDTPPTLTATVASVMDSVVGISVVKLQPAGAPGEEPHLIASSGSGFVIQKGYVLSNAHVLDHALAARIVTQSGATYTINPREIWSDPVADLAVAKVAADLPPITWADMKQVKLGEPVFVVGAPFGLRFRGSVSRGIISGFDRPLGADYPFLQTDAPINPGNSGGPLFNAAGQVVGVNARGIRGADGMGFSIPADLAKSVAEALIKDGKVDRPWFGLRFIDGEEAALGFTDWDGPVVTMVEPDGPAAQSGIQVGDTLLKLNGRGVKSIEDLAVFLRTVTPGTPVTLTYGSGDREVDVKLTLSSRPHDAQLYMAAEGLWVNLTPAQVSLARRIGTLLSYVDPADLRDPWTARAGDARATLVTEFFAVARRAQEKARAGSSLTADEAAAIARKQQGLLEVQIDLPTRWKVEEAQLRAEWQDEAGSFRADSVKVTDGAPPGFRRILVTFRSTMIEHAGGALVVLHLDEGTDRRFLFSLDSIH